MTVAKRAYGVEDKQLRREAIVESARALFAAGAGDLPSVGHIAGTAGLAKGTVYLYFRTKEAIFADLLLAGWGALLSDVDEAISGAGGGNGAEGGGDRASRIAALVARLTTHFGSHPELLRLDALGHEIERNLDPDALAAFKRGLNDRLAASGRVMEQALRLPDGRGLEVLMRCYAFTRGLWLASAEEAEPAGQGFAAELADALTEYLRGALYDNECSAY